MSKELFQLEDEISPLDDCFSENLSFEEFVKAYQSFHFGVSLENENLRLVPKESIKSIFEQECAGLRIDRSFLRKIIDLQTRFVSKNKNHIVFFGGTLTGVERVIFSPDDRDRLFYDILQVDDESLKARLHKLPTINPEFKVSSDVFNLSTVWIMHAISVSPYLTEEQKLEGRIAICQYLQYKFLTSKLYVYFRYPADETIAKAVYAQMTKKFSLKFYGSWGAALRARAEDAVSKEGIHWDTIFKMNDDLRVVYMLNDLQGRIRDMLKNIYALHIQMRDQGIRVLTSSSIQVDIDGEEVLRDKTGGLVSYVRYIKSVIPDQNSFIKEELIKIVKDAMPSMYEKLLRQSLKWLSENYTYLKDDEFESVVDEIMEHAFHYFADNPSILQSGKDYGKVVEKLKGAYTSSRSTDARLLKLRELVEKLIREATHAKGDPVIAATRTGFMLYVVIRAITMKHYQSK